MGSPSKYFLSKIKFKYESEILQLYMYLKYCFVFATGKAIKSVFRPYRPNVVNGKCSISSVMAHDKSILVAFSTD